MPQHAVHILPPVPGPEVLDVLDHLCTTSRSDIALLHSATHATLSVLAFEPLVTFETDAEAGCSLMEGGRNPLRICEGVHPLAALEEMVGQHLFAAPHPLIGFLGFISYDIAHTLESIPLKTGDDLRWPLLHWSLFRHYLLFNHATRECTAISIDADPAISCDMLKQVRPMPVPAPGPSKIVQAQSAADYHTKIRRIQEYIAAGDIYQANLAQRWRIQTDDEPQHIYRRLCQSTPAHYAAFLRFSSADRIVRHVLSASPELFLQVAGRHAVTRPIKGTRPRGPEPRDPVRDAALREELLASGKDQAELAMIVDLLRNDLGRVSEYRSVQVTQPRELEAHPTLWHTVATIESDLQPDVGLAELLRALCPGGSITGAPKIRAMQILEELEGFRRALYCGNVGVIGAGNAPGAQQISLNIAIRTALMQEGHAFLYAGGGIVADSDAQAEYEETLHKAAAPFRALGLPLFG